MRNITKQDIDFLKNLQHIMNTQDTVCQADPRFWVVRGTIKEYGIEEGYEDGVELVNSEYEITISNMKELYDYLIENEIFNNLNVEYDKEEECITLYYKDGEEIGWYDTLDDFYNDYYNDISELNIVRYKNVEHNFEDTFFLTNEECKRHIECNYYHYPKDAHSYAMTAWRSPQVEKLYEILQNVNFDNLLNKVE